MAWEVEASDEFKDWYESLDEAERASVAENVDMLEGYGFPVVLTQTPSGNHVIEHRSLGCNRKPSASFCFRSPAACLPDSGR